MFNKNDKRRLYWLIDSYLMGEIDDTFFCDEFYYSFDLGIKKEELNELEQKAFIELNAIVTRFSPFKEDHLLDSNAFSTTQELKNKVIETRDMLRMK